MFRSKMTKPCLIAASLTAALAGPMVAWSIGQMGHGIAPDVEQACHNAAKRKAPQGYRNVATFEYDEEGTKVGIVRGSLEASYTSGKWTQVEWTCRISLDSRRVVHFQVHPSTGGHRLKAAASRF